MVQVQIVAPRLLKFTIRDAEQVVIQHARRSGTYLEEPIKAMSLLRSLTIGFDGVNLTSLFTLLSELKHLRYFVLRETKGSAIPSAIHLAQLRFQNLSTWMTSPPSSLRMVALPVGLFRDKWWLENEFGDLRSAVKQRDIDLCLFDWAG